MVDLPPCPECESVLTYEDGPLLICPECGHEWEAAAPKAGGDKVIRDSVGNPLADGDTVTVIKDLKVKGSSLVVKRGTKVKNIRLVDGDHDIDCKIDGIGAMGLKSEFVKKA
jgi:protein PhnA